MSYQKVILIGNVGRDPAIRYMEKRPMAAFSYFSAKSALASHMTMLCHSVRFTGSVAPDGMNVSVVASENAAIGRFSIYRMAGSEFDNFTGGSRAIADAIVKATKDGAFSLVGGGDSVLVLGFLHDVQSQIQLVGLTDTLADVSAHGFCECIGHALLKTAPSLWLAAVTLWLASTSSVWLTRSAMCLPAAAH